MEYIIVQAGGKGTRLGYLTKNKPKALVSVENLPMIFHLFRKYPDKKFIVIADYHKEVLREYLSCFAEVKYQVVDAQGEGTCAGIRQALGLIPAGQPFMLVWSDLILPKGLELPGEYEEKLSQGVLSQNAGCIEEPVWLCQQDYIGISGTFPCRWSYTDGRFIEEGSMEHGVAGFFLFTDKGKLENIPTSGELVRWMQEQQMAFQEFSLAGTKEFGILEEYEKLGQEKCRPFNRITVEGDILTKEAVDGQGQKLAVRECLWYEKARQRRIQILPRIYGTAPLRMEYIQGKNIYECRLSYGEKKEILAKIISALSSLHQSEHIAADSFSLKEAYYNKTMKRLKKVEDLIPFAREPVIRINGKDCRNVYFHKRELERRLEKITCKEFHFIHGDCTFSNLMLREDGTPVLIDPRGYFGFTELYGDVRYDWAKLYYSIVGNYDRFNLKDFRLEIGEQGVTLQIQSNHWEDMEQDFFRLTGADPEEIKLLHAVIWLSLTTYAWQDYDSVCGAFYNGLYYLEDLL
nr:NTP transferase domain-containing protein [uncultured Schaedlerella sp.]